MAFSVAQTDHHGSDSWRCTLERIRCVGDLRWRIPIDCLLPPDSSPVTVWLKNSSLPHWRLSRTCWLMSTCYSFNPLVTILDTHNARLFQYPRSPTAACSISREMYLGPIINQLFTSAHFITTNNRTTCFDWSLSHFQVLNMLHVSGSCAHIWDPNSVYIETIPIH